MKGAVALVLLFCLSGAWARGVDGESSTPMFDLWEQMSALRDMVVEQRAGLTFMETRVNISESQLDDMKREYSAQAEELSVMGSRLTELQRENAAQAGALSVMEASLTASEGQVDQLKQDNAAQAAELSAMGSRLTASEGQVTELQREHAATGSRVTASEGQMEEMKKENAAQAAELSVMEARVTASEGQVTGLGGEVDEMKTENAAQAAELSAMGSRVTASEGQVEELKTENEKRPKVAFSAALGGSIGPVSSDTTVAYRNIITSIGKSYCPFIGKFRAPVKGVYYFRFTAMENSRSSWVPVSLYKNNEQVMNVRQHTNSGNQFVSSGVTLQLEKGDLVYMRLRKGGSLYDTKSNKYNTFSGALLFPL